MLCAVGDLIEDIVVQLRGDINRDTDTSATIVRRRGGSAANVAYFAAKLTGQSRFVGCIGKDDLGDSLATQLSRHGVDVCGERHGRTGSIVVVATADGVRTMLTDRGSATELTSFDAAWLDDVNVIHVPLYSFSHEPLRTAAYSAMRAARAKGALLSLDLSSVALIESLGVAATRALVHDVSPDIVFCTRAEAETAGLSHKNLLGAKQVVVKDGAGPIRVCTAEGEVRFPVDVVEQVVDATGAGDAFAAGFLTALSQGLPTPGCIDRGRVVAARVVMLPGATMEAE